jgi:hypothetical protein
MALEDGLNAERDCRAGLPRTEPQRNQEPSAGTGTLSSVELEPKMPFRSLLCASFVCPAAAKAVGRGAVFSSPAGYASICYSNN